MSLEMFCKRPVVSVSPRSTVYEACQLLKEENLGCLVAQEDGQLSGILTDRDIAIKVSGEGKDSRQTRVGEIMTPNPARISVDKSLHDLTTLMHALHVRRMPIVDGGGKAVGFVTLDDLIVLLADEMWEMGRTVSETILHKAA